MEIAKEKFRDIFEYLLKKKLGQQFQIDRLNLLVVSGSAISQSYIFGIKGHNDFGEEKIIATVNIVLNVD